jgi:hypothetical protein
LNSPALDIIVNNYNYARFLPDAIDSALGQTYPRVTVIVVDDGSTDESRDVVESYGTRVTPVLKDHGGQPSALNAGFEKSRGDAVIFLDADDVLVSDIAERVAEAFASDKELVKVQYRMERVDEAGRRTGIVEPLAHLPMPQGDVRQEELTFPFDLTWMAMSGNAFASAALRRIFPIPAPDEDYRLAADWYLRHLTPLLGPVVSLSHVGLLRRVHGANLYEPSASSLDLEQIRKSIICAAHTERQLRRLAKELGLRDSDQPILSVSDLTNRLISIRLDAAHHPVPGDTPRKLVTAGVRAASRRADVRVPVRVAFGLWFLVAAAAPRSILRPLAEVFSFPERRSKINRFLGALHRQTSRPSARLGCGGSCRDPSCSRR